MPSIQQRLQQSSAKSSKTTIPPSVYPATVVKVEYDTRYKDGAYVLTYELQGEKKVYPFKELFIDNARFDRTHDFYLYLAANNVETVEDFLGCREEIDLRWDFSHKGKRELTIVDRSFIGFPGEAEESDTGEGTQ